MILRRNTILVGVVIIAMTVLAVAVTRQSSTQNPQNQTDDHKKVVEAIRRGGLREAARIKGHYVGITDPNWDWANFTLEALTQNSVGIVVGTPEHATSELSSSGDSINTHFLFRISEVVKGGPRFSAGEAVFVAVPGGKLDFDDGTSAEVQTPNFESMALGKQYLLFLYQNRNGSNVLLLTGGPQGLFELGANGKIKSHARPTDAVAKDADNKDRDWFLNAVRALAKKWPQPNSCCG